jgi:L-lysine 2,3-aminomutase
MAKTKMSVSLDSGKLERAQSFVNAASVSELLNVALARLIDEEQERRHVEGYVRIPVNDELAQWASARRDPMSDDVDWASLYGIDR